MKSLLFALVGLAFIALVDAASAQSKGRVGPREWSHRTVFVQLFEWPWDDVARECTTYLGPAGFSAVQVSPPQEHLSWPGHPWWERYQPVSYQIISRSGDRASFEAMVRECRRAGVDIYADVVLNHMAGMELGQGFAGHGFSHYDYPGLYGAQDFHHCGRNGNDDIVNFQDPFELFNCELLNLADLKTESGAVQQRLRAYLEDLQRLGVAGFRIDAAKHMPAQDVASILSAARNAYVFQELIVNPGDPVAYRDYLPNGDVTAYYYPFSLAEAFKWKRFHVLPTVSTSEVPSDKAIVFLNNHDLQRVRERSGLLSAEVDGRLFDLAQVFMLTWPYGYPQIYSSYGFKNFDDGPPLDKSNFTVPVLNRDLSCRAPWLCEHRAPWVAPLVRFRNVTDDAFYSSHWWSNGQDQLAFARGPLGFVVINASAATLERRFLTDFTSGTVTDLLASPAQKYRVDASGAVDLKVAPMSAVVLLKDDLGEEKFITNSR